MSFGTVQAEKMTTESGYSLGAGNASSFKNRLINGNMDIDQRNAGASVTISAAAYIYTLDRWAAYASQASKFTVQQNAGAVTPPSGFTDYLGATVGASANVTVGASDIFIVRQAIEGFNCADLGWGSAGAKPVTISFWVRSSLTGTFGGAINTNSAGYAYPFTYTINSANTWEFKSFTVVGPTVGGIAYWPVNNGSSIRLNFSLGGGSTYSGTAGAWVAQDYFTATGSTNLISTNSATWYMTGCQVEVGTVATSFDFRSIGTETALCQRYFCKSFEPSVKPGDLSGGGIYTTMAAYTTANSYVSITYTFPAQMRATPSVVFYTSINGAGPAKWNYYSAGVWATGDAQVNAASSTNLTVNMLGMSGLTAYNAYLVAGNFTASAEL
jgi:hypothetical protein